MNDRTSSILAIRPKINNIDSNIDSKEIESFQNKVLRPSEKEIKYNNRSRSAKLRFATRSKTKFEHPKNLIEKFRKLLDLEAINV